MKCKTCGSRLKKLKDDAKVKEACEQLRLPYCGAFICLKCYPKKGLDLNTTNIKKQKITEVRE